jgi:hypothetical protein
MLQNNFLLETIHICNCTCTICSKMITYCYIVKYIQQYDIIIVTFKLFVILCYHINYNSIIKIHINLHAMYVYLSKEVIQVGL